MKVYRQQTSLDKMDEKLILHLGEFSVAHPTRHWYDPILIINRI